MQTRSAAAMLCVARSRPFAPIRTGRARLRLQSHASRCAAHVADTQMRACITAAAAAAST